MNGKLLKLRMTAAVAAAALLLTACSGVQASLTVPDASSSVTYRASLAIPDKSSSTAGRTSSVLPKAQGSDTAKVEYYFPRAGQKAEPELISVIGSAKKTLDIAIYSFTDGKVGSAVAEAHRRGVAVRVITDREQASGQYQKALLKGLVKAGIPVKIDTHSGLMHLKVTIADGEVATTGSYNYTKSAENSNDEVFVVLRDEKAAQDFEAEFGKMWNDTKNFKSYR